MNGPELHRLLSSLTKGEKRQFKIYASGKPSVLIEIFDLVNAQKEYSEQAVLRRIPKREIYRKYDQLRELVIEALAYYSKDVPRDGFEMIHIALDLDESEFALRRLTEIAQRAIKQNDHLVYYRSVSMLDHLPYPSQFPSEFPKKSEARAMVKRALKWDELLEGMKNLLSNDREEGKLRFYRYKEELASLEIGASAEDAYNIAKLKMEFALFENQIEKAFHWQGKLVETLETAKVGQIQWVKEVSQMANLAIDIGDCEKASEWTIKLGQKELSPPAHSRREKEWISISLHSSLKFGQFDSADLALSKLKSFLGISDSKKAILFHLASLVCLYSHQKNETIHWVNELLTLPSINRQGFTWQPLLVLYLAHFSHESPYTFGSIDDHIFQRLERSIAKTVKTPLIFVETLRKYQSSKSGLDLENGLQEIQRMKELVSEQMCFRYFHFEEYLFSLLKGVGIAEVLNNPYPLRNYQAKDYL